MNKLFWVGTRQSDIEQLGEFFAVLLRFMEAIVMVILLTALLTGE